MPVDPTPSSKPTDEELAAIERKAARKADELYPPERRLGSDYDALVAKFVRIELQKWHDKNA